MPTRKLQWTPAATVAFDEIKIPLTTVLHCRFFMILLQCICKLMPVITVSVVINSKLLIIKNIPSHSCPKLKMNVKVVGQLQKKNAVLYSMH